jgi:polar amino acid transport system substrate-binding protein
MRALSIALVCLLTHSLSFAADKPPIKACTENEDSFQWVLKDRPGLTVLMLRMVEKQVGGKIEVVPLPWKRCLDDVKTGAVDAAFKISYSAARAAELGNYPMSGDKPDASKRLLIDSYSLYRVKGTPVEWDGKVLKVPGSVGAQSGFSVVDQLKGLGAKVDDGTRSADDNLKKLVAGRFVALALQTDEGDISVENNPEFKGKVERIKPFLVEKPYFLIFSKPFTTKNAAYVQEVWDAIGKVRESPEYTGMAKSFK